MNKCFYLIKRYIQIIVLLLNLISFIIINIIHSRKKSYYSEYTTLPKISSNIFIIILLLIMLSHTIYPKMMCGFLADNFNLLMNDRGKIIVNISIGILYWSCDDTPILVFTCINFVSSFALFLCEFIFQCNILHNEVETGLEEDKNSNEKINVKK